MSTMAIPALLNIFYELGSCWSWQVGETHRAGCSSPSPRCQETALPVNGSTSDSVTLIISAVVEMWQMMLVSRSCCCLVYKACLLILCCYGKGQPVVVGVT